MSEDSSLVGLVTRHATTAHGQPQPTAVPALSLFRSETVHVPIHSMYQPSVCLVVQGSKSVALGREVVNYTPERYLLVSVSVPVVGRVTEASPACPYLAVNITLDAALIASVVMDLGPVDESRPIDRRGVSVHLLDPMVRDAATRLVRLLDIPTHIPMLAPLVMRELTYLLLVGPQGATVREMVLKNSTLYRIAAVIERLRREYDQALRLETLATAAGMSMSSLHQQFKAVTTMSPLQYLKQVRLQEARRLLLSENIDVASAALRVGYESHSQFSREYRRLFGAPPSHDVVRLRNLSYSNLGEQVDVKSGADSRRVHHPASTHTQMTGR